VSQLTLFMLGKAVENELTKEEFENDLDNLGLDIHKEYLINTYINSKDKIKAKIEEKELLFNNSLKNCVWKLNRPVKVSYGKLLSELNVTIKIYYKDINNKSDSITLETDVNKLKLLVKDLQNCLNEATKVAGEE